MSPGSTARFRRLTAALVLCWALLALFAGVRSQIRLRETPLPPFSHSSAAGWHVIHALTPEAEAAGLRSADRWVSLDGQSVSEWFARGDAILHEGVPNRYEIESRDGSRKIVMLTPRPAGAPVFPSEQLVRVAIPAVGLIYLVIGAIVFQLKSAREEAWALLLFCSSTSALLFLAGSVDPVNWSLIAVTVPLMGASSFHLFSIYPTVPRWIAGRPHVRSVAYGIALVLGGLGVVAPFVSGMMAIVNPANTFFTLMMGMLGVGIVVSERARLHRGLAADRSTVAVIGALVSFVPVTVAIILHTTVGTRLPWSLALLGFFLFPLALGYGILRSDLFDIRLLARSSAAYGAVTLGITGAFALFITFADALVGRFDMDARSPVASVVFLFFAILLFNPLRNRLQQWVDRFFDRDRVAYRDAVREISEAMVSMLSVREIVERILIAVTDTMGAERALVLLVGEDGETYRAEAARGDWDEDLGSFSIDAEHPVCRGLWMRRTELARVDFDEETDPDLREQCRDVFDTLEVELLVPVLFGVDLLGVIAVGRQINAEHLGPAERELLRTLANQSAIAIENAQAFDEIAKLNETLEARVEERTRELRETQSQLVQSEKMRSLGQLVAGVAHELNNPIGFVHANLQLLDGYVERLVSPGSDADRRRKSREAIDKLLGRSREGTDRVKQIVRDLRTFSRTDHADLQQVCLNEEIDRTLTLMEPRLKTGVQVDRDYADLPQVRGFIGQLNQVFMNLLMNACDAMEGRGTISIRTRPEGDGVRLEFADDGPGMPEEVKSRIFDPFFTTKPVGQGTGLGLSLSHGIIERHGGTMEVETEAGIGTTFVLHLPLEPPEDAFEQARDGAPSAT
ncbi:MAG: GAF domain-containing protein [bacterium]|nr:GAF domain-containing protein [bacterium]